MAEHEWWERLSLLESRDIVQSHCNRLTGRRPNASHAREVASRFVQARQYIQAARLAGDLVRPLLGYYAFATLAGAVVMIRRFVRETTLAPAHGLQAVDWGATLSRGPSAIPDVQIRVTRGTFHELCEATPLPSFVTAFTGPYPDRMRLPKNEFCAPAPGVTLSLREVWQRIPGICELFGQICGENMQYFETLPFTLGTKNGATSVGITLFANGPHLFRQSSTLFPEATDARFAPTSSYLGLKHLELFAPRANHSVEFSIACADESALRAVAQYMTNTRAGGVFSTGALADGAHLSQLHLLYCASYAAGMFVRYHPNRWQELGRQEAGDQVLAVFRRATSIVEDRMASAILQAIEEEVTPVARPV